MAKKKGKKKGRKNPGVMAVTNPKGKGKGKKRRNPRGFLARSFDKLGKAAMLAAPNLGGRYLGEVGGVVGSTYLDKVTAGFGATTAQVLLAIGLGQFAPSTAGWRQAGIGLVTEAAHQLLVENMGVDLPAMALKAVVPKKEPTAAEAAAAKAAAEAVTAEGGGVGALFRGVPAFSGASPYR